ncbi:MAG: prephenate dehydrogenase/arogenate dehydrogenase family protein [Verrucomicrobiota bacterium]
MIQTLAVLGPGLLGASLMWAAKARGVAARVVAWSRRAESRQACAEQPWCDEVFETAHVCAGEADVVVLAVPVAHIVPLIGEIAPALKPGALVTDVGSTKRSICRAAHELMPAGAHFVGAHPMAGSEKTGLAHASPLLFEGRTCAVTPLEGTDPTALAMITKFWEQLGMRVYACSPACHDTVVAHTSHLPHLLASSLCEMLSRQDPDWPPLHGAGLRDTTRIAAGDPQLWQAIVQENRKEILQAIDAFSQHWSHLREAIAAEDDEALTSLLEAGKNFRDSLEGQAGT